MTSARTTTTLSQLADLAFHAPDMGVINFTMLHAIIQVIIDQTQLRNTKIEFHNEDAERVRTYMAASKAGPKLTLTEYSLGPDGKGPRTKKRRKSTDEKGQSDQTQTEKNKVSSTSSPTVVVVEPAEPDANLPLYSVAITEDLFNKLQNDLTNLEEKVEELTELPKNEELLKAIKTSKDGDQTPIQNIFQVLSLTKRMDAAEVAVTKLAGMIEDLAKQGSQLMSLAETAHHLASEGTKHDKDKPGTSHGHHGGGHETHHGGTGGGTTEDGGHPSKSPHGASPSAVVSVRTGEASNAELPAGHQGHKEHKDHKEHQGHQDPNPEQQGTHPANKVSNMTKHSSEVLQQVTELRQSFEDTNGVKKMHSIERRVTELEQFCETLKKGPPSRGSGGRSPKPSHDLDSSPQQPQQPQQPHLPHQAQQYPPRGSTTSPDAESSGSQGSQEVQKNTVTLHIETDAVREDVSDLPVKEAFNILQNDLWTFKDNVAADLKDTIAELVQLKDALDKVAAKQTTDFSDTGGAQINNEYTEAKLKQYADQINSLDAMFSENVEAMQERISDIEREVGVLMEKVQISIPAAEMDSGQNMAELYSKMLQMQQDLNQVTETANRLWQDRDIKQTALDVMMEQIELLKTVKANKEELEDALADKADACLINKKVSYSQFDAACDDLTKGIEEALVKLGHQEALWTGALQEIQKEVGSKLDRMELGPLRDFINNKLKHLHEKFKQLHALKKEHEAAGTKHRLLKDVNCISCDKEVIMKRDFDPSMFPKAKALPPNRNMGPYLAYELDQLRKQQKCIPASKNLNMFENALKSDKVSKETGHICNRYCGGSHTVTTAQQRVTRMGHFLEQWGPEIVPVNETNIKGTDGHYYKGRPEIKKERTSVEQNASFSLGKTNVNQNPSGSAVGSEGKRTPKSPSQAGPSRQGTEPTFNNVEPKSKIEEDMDALQFDEEPLNENDVEEENDVLNTAFLE